MAQGLVNSSARIVPAFHDQIEVIVRLNRRTGWTFEAPGFL